MLCVLKRDGKEVFKGTELECVQYVHKSHGFSFDHAVKHEGYSLHCADVPTPGDTEEHPPPAPPPGGDRW